MITVESFTITEGYTLLSPVIIYIVGMVIYALFGKAHNIVYTKKLNTSFTSQLLIRLNTSFTLFSFKTYH